MTQTLSPIDMINSFNDSNLKDLLKKQKEYERIDTILHISSTIINISTMVLSTLAGIHFEYLAFVALGCSAGTVALGGAIKANTQAMINNNITKNNLLKSLKIYMTVSLLDDTSPTPVSTPN